MLQLKYDKYTSTRIVGYVFTLKDEFYECWETDKDIAFAFQFPEEYVYPYLDKSPSHITLKDWKSDSKIICDSAFMNCKELLSIDIPEEVTTIESKAFQGCENLYAVYLPSSVTEIQDSAFDNCHNLKEVIFKKKNPEQMPNRVFDF